MSFLKRAEEDVRSSVQEMTASCFTVTSADKRFAHYAGNGNKHNICLDQVMFMHETAFLANNCLDNTITCLGCYCKLTNSSP